MNSITIKVLITVFFGIFVVYIYLSDQETIKKTKKILNNISKKNKSCETLSWIVKLEFHDDTWEEDEIEMLADQVAEEVGLKKCGFVGIKNRYHHLIHPHVEECRNAFKDLKNWEKEKNRINSLLKNHPFIESFEQQYEKIRKVRSIDHTASHTTYKPLQTSSQIPPVTIRTLDEKKKFFEFDSSTVSSLIPKLFFKSSPSQRTYNKALTSTMKTVNLTMPPQWKPLEYRGTLSGLETLRDDMKSTSKYMNNKQAFFIPSNETLGDTFNDPLFYSQWHLVNSMRPGWDLNVSGVWQNQVNGQGVNVAIIDDGLDWKSKDITGNYNPAGSFNLISNQADPRPSHSKDKNNHGTRCAGEVAGVANNNFCGVGVAYKSTVSGIRLIDKAITDAMEARAFNVKNQLNHIYSCSWGPEDDGGTLDGPGKLTTHALREGTEYGRHGYGSIYVVASGNGGRKKDNCNYDGYANSVFTITIGSIDEYAKMPAYGEECASMLAVAYSSGTHRGRDIVTSDWGSDYGGDGCTMHHSGTSAAAPLAAALIALMLQVRPCLTWRDVQYIVAISAVKIDVDKSLWTRNQAGLWHSHQHGFGVMDAWRLSNAAKVWPGLPWMTSYLSEISSVQLPLRQGHSVNASIYVSSSNSSDVGIATLEYVHVALRLRHVRRGDLRVHLHCPSGTHSLLAETRPHDGSTEGYQGWLFSTVRCWGEEVVGSFQLMVTDNGTGATGQERGLLQEWQLILYGSSLMSAHVQDRIRLVQEASSGGGVLNSTHVPACPPPSNHLPTQATIQKKYLKVILMVGIFVCIMAVYDTIEYSCFYRSEKQKTDHLFEQTKDVYEMVPLVEVGEGYEKPVNNCKCYCGCSCEGRVESMCCKSGLTNVADNSVEEPITNQSINNPSSSVNNLLA